MRQGAQLFVIYIYIYIQKISVIHDDFMLPTGCGCSCSLQAVYYIERSSRYIELLGDLNHQVNILFLTHTMICIALIS